MRSVFDRDSYVLTVVIPHRYDPVSPSRFCDPFSTQENSPMTVTMTEETAAGQEVGKLTLELLSARISVREMLRSRVYQQLQDSTRELARRQGQTYIPPPKALFDAEWKKQTEKAWAAFDSGTVVLLVDNRQMDTLEDTISIGADTAITFVKLRPLVGG
jgi:hypothetical protein